MVLAIVVLVPYLLLTNKIEGELLYPINNEWFTYRIYQRYANESCFIIRPNYISLDNTRNTLEIYTPFEKDCDFDSSITWIYVNGAGYVTISSSNLSMDIYRNLSDPNRIRIIVNGSDMGLNEFYQIRMIVKLNQSIYNRYILSAEGSSIDQFVVKERNDLLGYFCDQNCYNVINGPVIRDEITWRGNVKRFNFDNARTIEIESSPKSKEWFFIQKVMDGIVLGILSVLLYEAFTHSVLRKLDQK